MRSGATRHAPLFAAIAAFAMAATVLAPSTPAEASVEAMAAEAEAAANQNGWFCGAYDQSAKRGRDPVAAGSQPYPLVTIHGITGSDDDFDGTIDLSFGSANPQPPRSLLTALAGSYLDLGERVPPGLPGVHVFSFSYTPDSLRWVDHARVGGKFAETIDCLHEAFGRPVIVVAHSMGGLVTRWVANTKDRAGVARSSKVAKVVTLGTPYEGSYLSSLANGATDVAGVSSAAVALLNQLCGDAGTGSGRGSCGPIPLYAQLRSEAGRKLRVGTEDLRRLERWPSGMDVAAIAGAIRVPMALFGSPLNSRIDLGDAVVGRGSAVADPGEARTFECDYDTAAASGAARLPWIGDPTKRRAELGRLVGGGGPCFHSNLMRNVEVTTEVLGQISDWLAANPAPRAPNDVGDLVRAFVGAVIEGRPARHLASPEALDAATALQASGALPKGPGHRVRLVGEEGGTETEQCEMEGDISGSCSVEVRDGSGRTVARLAVDYQVTRESDGFEHIDGAFYDADGNPADWNAFHPQVVDIVDIGEPDCSEAALVAAVKAQWGNDPGGSRVVGVTGVECLDVWAGVVPVATGYAGPEPTPVDGMYVFRWHRDGWMWVTSGSDSEFCEEASVPPAVRELLYC